MSVVDVRDAITRAHHEEWARVVASLARGFGDLDVAEEAAAGRGAVFDLKVAAKSQERFVTTLVDSAVTVGLASPDTEAGTVTFTAGVAGADVRQEPNATPPETGHTQSDTSGGTGTMTDGPLNTSNAPVLLRQVWPTATGEIVLAIHSTAPLPASAFGLMGEVVKAADELARSIGLSAPTLTMLPDRGWQSYEDALRRVGERRPAAKGDDPLRAFLTTIGLLREDRQTLSEAGLAYFNAKFIKGDAATSDAALHRCVMDYPPATAVTQLLAGVPDADRGRVETVLRSQGFKGVTDRAVGSLLTLMDRAGLVDYNSRTSSVSVLKSPVTAVADAVPPSVFISPTTPFGNKVWLRRVLAECTGSIDWLDKHFMPVASRPSGRPSTEPR